MVTCCSCGCCLLLTDLSLHRDVARSVVRGNTWRGDRRRWGAVGGVRLASQRSAAVTPCNGNNVNFNIWMVKIGFYNYIVYDCIYWYFKKFKVSKKLFAYYWWISNLSFTLFTQAIKCTRMLRSQTCYKFKKYSTKWLFTSHLWRCRGFGCWCLSSRAAGITLGRPRTWSSVSRILLWRLLQEDLLDPLIYLTVVLVCVDDKNNLFSKKKHDITSFILLTRHSTGWKSIPSKF